MMRTRTIVVACIIAVPNAAHADETHDRAWSLSAEVGYTILGPSRHQTGGTSPGASLTYRHAITTTWSMLGGARFQMIGIESGARWIGILGGVGAGVELHASHSFATNASAHIDAGRLPVCNTWGLCLRFNGLYPALETQVLVTRKAWRIGAQLGSALIMALFSHRVLRTS